MANNSWKRFEGASSAAPLSASRSGGGVGHAWYTSSVETPEPPSRQTGSGYSPEGPGRDLRVSQTIFTVVGVVTALLVFVVGVALLSGLLLPASVPDNYRITLGIVMTVYGTYRVVMLVMKFRKGRRNDREA